MKEHFNYMIETAFDRLSRIITIPPGDANRVKEVLDDMYQTGYRHGYDDADPEDFGF